MNMDTELRNAIRDNDTERALNIIRIEQEAYLHRARRSEELNSNLDVPVLETLNEGRLLSTSIVIHAAQFGRDQVIQYIVDIIQSRWPEPLSSPSWQLALNYLLTISNDEGVAPLIVAAEKGHLSTVKVLLKYIPLVREHGRGNDEVTPLMFAARRGHAEICRTLIKHGDDVNAKTEKGATALLLACKCGWLDVVKELVVSGCYLQYKDYKSCTSQHVVLERMERRREFPAHSEDMRRELPSHSDMIYLGAWEDEDELEGSDGVFFFSEGTYSTDEEMLFLLNPLTQVELMQFAVRVERNLEIVRCYTMLQKDLGEIVLSKDSAYDIPTSVASIESLSENLVAIHRSVSNINFYGTQLLVRTMFLPVAVIQIIALFMPLPPLWAQRFGLLQKTINDDPNEAVVSALDIIDEILEHIGFLSACDFAKIPAPYPHRTWSDWKRSAKRSTILSYQNDNVDDDDDDDDDDLDITTLGPPLPKDVENPTIVELRRMVGYLPLLSRYEHDTSIVTLLTGHPYNVPRVLIDRLIRIADFASICRRCCILTDDHCNIASDILSLTAEFILWEKGGDDDGIDASEYHDDIDEDVFDIEEE